MVSHILGSRLVTARGVETEVEEFSQARSNIGLAGAIQLEAYPGEPARRPFEIALKLWEKGVYVRCGGDTLQFAPPFISSTAEIDRLFQMTAEVMAAQA